MRVIDIWSYNLFLYNYSIQIKAVTDPQVK